MKLSDSSLGKEAGLLSWPNQAVMMAAKGIVAGFLLIICLTITIQSRMRAQEE